MQAVGGLIIFMWSFTVSGLVFLAIKVTFGGIRVSEEVEMQGLDYSEHGVQDVKKIIALLPPTIYVGQAS